MSEPHPQVLVLFIGVGVGISVFCNNPSGSYMSQRGEPAIQNLVHHTPRGGEAPPGTAWPRGHVWASTALLPTNLPLPTPPPQPSSASSPPPAGSHSLLPRSPSHPHPLLSPDTLPIHSPRPCQDLASSLSPAQQGSEVRSLVLAAPGPRTEPTQPLSQAGLGWAAAAAGGQAEAAGSRHFPIKQIRRLGCLGGTSAGGFGKGLEPGEKRSSSSTSEKAF